jgi:hypothetical protein
MKSNSRRIISALIGGVSLLVLLTALGIACSTFYKSYPNVAGFGFIVLLILYPIAAVPGSPTWATILNVAFDIGWLSAAVYLVTLIFRYQRRELAGSISVTDLGTRK